MIYLFESTILWMKMISYAHVNTEVRKDRKEELAFEEAQRKRAESGEEITGRQPSNSMLGDMKDMEPPYIKVFCIHSNSTLSFFAPKMLFSVSSKYFSCGYTIFLRGPDSLLSVELSSLQEYQVEVRDEPCPSSCGLYGSDYLLRRAIYKTDTTYFSGTSHEYAVL
jgi:hypothetical protein